MDIGKPFIYVTQDQDWIKKVLIGGLITLIPIVGPFFAFGYVLATMKNVIAEQEVPLPEIGDFGGKLVEGLKVWVISLVGELLGMLKSNIGPAVIVLLVIWLASFVAMLVGTIACGIGLIFTLFYAQLVMAFLYGSLYRQAKAKAVALSPA